MQYKYRIVSFLFKTFVERIILHIFVTEQFMDAGYVELLHGMLLQDYRNCWQFWVCTYELGALEST
jgi:hypothetical protein